LLLAGLQERQVVVHLGNPEDAEAGYKVELPVKSLLVALRNHEIDAQIAVFANFYGILGRVSAVCLRSVVVEYACEHAKPASNVENPFPFHLPRGDAFEGEDAKVITDVDMLVLPVILYPVSCEIIIHRHPPFIKHGAVGDTSLDLLSVSSIHR
jgi:hypothetical protein